MKNWQRLTAPQIKRFVDAGAFSTYKGEEILIDPYAVQRGESADQYLYFNAQEFFSKSQLNDMEWYKA